MSNTLYDSARQGFLEGNLDWSAATVKVMMIDTGEYTFSQTHVYRDDVEDAAVVATSGALTGKTATAGVADADNVVFQDVEGSEVGALIVFFDTGNPVSSPLIAFIDTITGLPFTPDGGDTTILWSDGSSKIFKL